MEGPSPRPRSKYTPEEWRALTIPDRIVAERKEALEKEIEQKKKEDKDKKKKDDGAGSSKDNNKKKKKESKGKKDDDDDPKDISPSPSIHLSKERYIDEDDEMGGKESLRRVYNVNGATK